MRSHCKPQKQTLARAAHFLIANGSSHPSRMLLMLLSSAQLTKKRFRRHWSDLSRPDLDLSADRTEIRSQIQFEKQIRIRIQVNLRCWMGAAGCRSWCLFDVTRVCPFAPTTSLCVYLGRPKSRFANGAKSIRQVNSLRVADDGYRDLELTRANRSRKLEQPFWGQMKVGAKSDIRSD